MDNSDSDMHEQGMKLTSSLNDRHEKLTCRPSFRARKLALKKKIASRTKLRHSPILFFRNRCIELSALTFRYHHSPPSPLHTITHSRCNIGISDIGIVSE
ncbi:hypothetical protein ACMFMG_006526 [Clarireedia jacksonii]